MYTNRDRAALLEAGSVNAGGAVRA
jgi:hypothetical protein